MLGARGGYSLRYRQQLLDLPASDMLRVRVMSYSRQHSVRGQTLELGARR